MIKSVLNLARLLSKFESHHQLRLEIKPYSGEDNSQDGFARFGDMSHFAEAAKAKYSGVGHLKFRLEAENIVSFETRQKLLEALKKGLAKERQFGVLVRTARKEPTKNEIEYAPRDNRGNLLKMPPTHYLPHAYLELVSKTPFTELERQLVEEVLGGKRDLDGARPAVEAVLKERNEPVPIKKRLKTLNKNLGDYQKALIQLRRELEKIEAQVENGVKEPADRKKELVDEIERTSMEKERVRKEIVRALQHLREQKYFERAYKKARKRKSR